MGIANGRADITHGHGLDGLGHLLKEAFHWYQQLLRDLSVMHMHVQQRYIPCISVIGKNRFEVRFKSEEFLGNLDDPMFFLEEWIII